METENLNLRNPKEAKERLIVALDVATKAAARKLVSDLHGEVSFFKVGYQLFLAEGMSFVRELIAQGNRVFLDLKVDDVEETIMLAVREMTKNKVSFLTIHGQHGDSPGGSPWAGARTSTRTRASTADPVGHLTHQPE